MVQPVEYGRREDAAAAALDAARYGGVVREGLVRALVVVVLHVLKEHVSEVILAESDDVVGAFPADRTDQSLDEWVLPG